MPSWRDAGSARRDNSAYGGKNTGSVGYAYSFSGVLRASASVGSRKYCEI